MLRISLIGGRDLGYHYSELLGIPRQKLDKEIESISKILADLPLELVLLPDRGISFEVAKLYKRFNGGKVYGTVPVSDNDFGIKHLEPYINAEINGKKVIDKIIDTQNWYKQDLTCCIYGDYILMLGTSLGSLGELVYGYYLYKLFMGEKPEVNVMKKKIHEEVRCGEHLPFGAIVYKPFVKDKLPCEIEEYIKKLKGNVNYVNNPKELKEKLEKLIKEYK
jgi:hypothetical protein